MLMSERWRNGAKAALGAGVYRLHLPGRVDVVSILKLWRRVPVCTCVAVGDRSGSGSDWPQAAAARVKYLDIV